jgi:hypothetical protein
VPSVDALPPPVAERLAVLLDGAPPDERPFSHPVDWAAFTYLGV